MRRSLPQQLQRLVVLKAASSASETDKENVKSSERENEAQQHTLRIMEQNTVKVIDIVVDQGVDSKGDILVGRENIHNTLPPHESYEGRHRHDPLAEWTAAEERSVVRKTDLRLLSWLCIMVRFVSPY